MKRYLLAILMAARLAGAEDLPDLGDRSQTLLTAQQEQKIAADALRYLRLSPQWLGDAEVNDYLNDLIDKIVAANPDIKQSFTAVGLHDDSINAFAIPGGVIGMHSGLVIASRSESELAGVFCHEMAHITQHHISRLMEAQKRAFWPTMAALAAALIAARSNTELGSAGIAATQAYSTQLTLDFQREHEREADRIGMRYLQRSGFDPHGMPSFFERMQQQTRFMESNAPAYLRTHPVNLERIADAEARLSDLSYHQYPDSLGYLLIKEKMRVLTQPAARLEEEYANRIAGNAGQSLLVARYGLARLRLKERRAEDAWPLAQSLQTALPHPMTAKLAADVQLARQRTDEAIKLTRSALERYPLNTALRETLIEAMLDAKRGEQALDAIQDYQNRNPDSLDAWEWKANALHALDRKAESHLALAEFYWRLGASGDAMRQLRIARAQPDLSPYVAARIDSRMKAMQGDGER